jgi:hypothetical protein
MDDDAGWHKFRRVLVDEAVQPVARALAWLLRKGGWPPWLWQAAYDVPPTDPLDGAFLLGLALAEVQHQQGPLPQWSDVDDLFRQTAADPWDAGYVWTIVLNATCYEEPVGSN